MKTILSLIAATFLLTNCGGPSGNSAPQKTDTAEMTLFAAPWCHPCHNLAEDISAALVAKGEAFSKRISITAVIVTGENPNKEPTIADIETERLKLGRFFTPVADENWKTYKKFYGKKGPIPGVVVNPNSQNPKVFIQGTQSPVIMAYLEAVLK